VYTYPAEMHWGSLNLLVSAGAVVLVAGFAVFLFNVFASLRSGPPASDNPWDAGTLEWAAASPPPPQNFSRIPLVTSREPLWSERESLPVLEGLRVDRREILVSTVPDARPDLRHPSPEPSIWPFLAAV